MASIELKIKGLNKLQVALKRTPGIIDKELDKGIARSMGTLERTAKFLVPVNTGRLRASHVVKLSRLSGILFPTVKYAIWVHDGTRPHIIRPKIKKALFWKGANHPVKQVNHPGSQGIPWMEATLNSKKREVFRFMQAAVNSAISKAFK